MALCSDVCSIFSQDVSLISSGKKNLALFFSRPCLTCNNIAANSAWGDLFTVETSQFSSDIIQNEGEENIIAACQVNKNA